MENDESAPVERVKVGKKGFMDVLPGSPETGAPDPDAVKDKRQRKAKAKAKPAKRGR